MRTFARSILVVIFSAGCALQAPRPPALDLTTAAVTALGLAPLAVGLSRPGQEIEGPMAVTVLGGLLSSTLLNLFVLPALAQR